ncbi:immunodominant staphylococcal antigen IsaB family protein [Staphylococcus equorum]|uniref:immunodominant staphylococcal antigen IsaB family protein n=1 Tax=Staphylococcus equorum TaxID=246432 RepID=UPI000D1C2DA3|nr:hypothetical protein [Staphylococcus equorum]MDG0825656.1 hypothetical protein [Staphylococcus equorum]MEB7672745.1 hypothetical protein [Staphylococcus equorum]MEB7688755.1 hypothetical protein [Staphylococcus equorum]MEB7717725.1 hypothetical protein [Staphylococcus equorum]MEB7758762.1 hypothetical protein [Staphylococcus equorum]
MNKKLLVLSSTVAATGFLLGAGNGVIGNNTAHADTMNSQENNMNNNMQQQAIPMEQDMNDMQGNMNHSDMPMEQGMNDMQGNMMNSNMEETMMPYYNYTGYTTYDGHFTQDYDFVRALKYDNVMIDGYKVNTATNDKDVSTSKKVNDTMVDMNKDGQVVNITFDTKADTVSKAMFKEAHMSNHMSDEGQTENGSYMTYETNNGMYTAHFDEQGYLMKVMIS